jgi:hypothetical protein
MQLTGIDVEAIDAERIAAVSKALGPQRFVELLTLLSVRLQCVSAAIELLPANARALLSLLHQSRGSAASLGLVGLGVILSEMEAQIARVLGACEHAADPTAMACIKIAGRALQGYWSAASRAAACHVPAQGPDHASGTRSK